MIGSPSYPHRTEKKSRECKTGLTAAIPVASHLESTCDQLNPEPCLDFSTTADNSYPSESTKISTDRMIPQTLAVGQASHGGNATPVEPSITTSTSPRPRIMDVKRSVLRSTFKMVIHLPNKDETKTRVAKLDTGSSVDVLSENVAGDLNMKMEEDKGSEIKPLGSLVKPIGTLTFDWHIMGKALTYTTTFVVLPNDYSKDFDVLVGLKLIDQIGFYNENEAVWYLKEV